MCVAANEAGGSGGWRNSGRSVRLQVAHLLMVGVVLLRFQLGLALVYDLRKAAASAE